MKKYALRVKPGDVITHTKNDRDEWVPVFGPGIVSAARLTIDLMYLTIDGLVVAFEPYDSVKIR